jgi:hypothetical protein
VTKCKIVVLPDSRNFEVPEDHNWMAMDEYRGWYSYKRYPKIECDAISGYWYTNPFTSPHRISDLIGPFEPGDWTKQIYWIGD